VKEHGNHTLFCGTKIIQTRYYGDEHVLAVVIRTGYLTSKGQLVRSIIYPPPADFKFDQDSYKFIMILTGISLCGFIYTIFSKYSRQIAPFDILIKALDLVTIAIPPALPAAMTVGKLYALNRLKKKNIYCINSRVINVSGSVDCVCFDKTGTLTEDGLDMWGVVPIEDHRIEKPIKDINTMAKDSLLFQGMLTCHSLTLIDNELCGDPLDIKMFESTGWILEEPTVSDTSKYDLLVPTIVKENSFESEVGKKTCLHIWQSGIVSEPSGNRFDPTVPILFDFATYERDLQTIGVRLFRDFHQRLPRNDHLLVQTRNRSKRDSGQIEGVHGAGVPSHRDGYQNYYQHALPQNPKIATRRRRVRPGVCWFDSTGESVETADWRCNRNVAKRRHEDCYGDR
jgi:magnesium-transporting ATPase (P-type)